MMVLTNVLFCIASKFIIQYTQRHLQKWPTPIPLYCFKHGICLKSNMEPQPKG